MNRRRFLGLLAGTWSAAATSYFFAPLGGWPLFIAKPWWHPDVLPGVLAELNAHYDEIRGYGVPLTARQWNEARAQQRSDRELWRVDPERAREVYAERRVQDRARIAPLARVVFYDLHDMSENVRSQQFPGVRAEDMALQIDERTLNKIA